jgi:NAD(P)-dependent dehydrogenase (short-subunit alcohol dehydrogenase family)
VSTRVAVITGAAREGSIGRAIAERLLKDGLQVVVSDIGAPITTHPDYELPPPSELELAVEALSELGEVHAVPCDVRDADQVQGLIDGAVDRFGRLDALVNNAGLAIGLQEIVDLSEDDWRLNLDVMATGVFLCSRAGARRMLEQQEGGRIVTIASQAAKTGSPMLGAYTAAKWAALGFTHGVTVNAVCPGTVDTPLLAVRGGIFDAYTAKTGYSVEEYRRRLKRQIPLRRFATPDDIAATVSFLISPDAEYITGESINVTGGQEMH